MRIRRLILVLCSAALLWGCEPAAPDYSGLIHHTGDDSGDDTPEVRPEDAKYNVSGRVTCEGAPVAGVVVSDGHEVTATDADGAYRLYSKKDYGYVFISIPGGYEVPRNGVIPEFFKPISSSVSTEDNADFTLKKVEQKNYTMLYFGDMHLADRMSDFAQFREFADDVNSLIGSNRNGPVYALTLGDMAWDRFWYRYDLADYLSEMNDDCGESLPVFHTIGNHDPDADATGDYYTPLKYRTTIGPTYYSFNVGGTHYVVLDDIDCRNTASERSFYNMIVSEEYQWLKKDLAYVSKSTPVIITMHAPLYNNSGDVQQRNGYTGLLSLFEGYDRVHVVTGHTHIVYNVGRLSSGVHAYESNSGAVCGGWWMTGANVGIHLSGDGAPGGYRVMDFTGKNYTTYFKGTGHSRDFQFRSYDRNELQLSAAKWTPNASTIGKKDFEEAVGEYATASSDNYVLLNVWDYDPSWKIEVKENGKGLPVTKLNDVKDPLYLVAYEAYEYENHYEDYVYYPAYTTKHIFRVQASSPTSTLNISVTDRYGKTFTETMTRPKAFTLDNYR
ncbi:MAG: calcineurin-like phosphoesterase family protein [Bacteroidales bacterium]|nr:calcineurin-like phosphoesterase family protein [Bacteroidales bacterium]